MNTDIYLYHILIISGELLIVFVLLHMLYHRRTAASIIAWVFAMILIPYITVILYLIFGSRKRKNRYKKESIKQQKSYNNYHKPNKISKVLNSYAIADTIDNESFEIYTDSAKSYDILMDCINNAKTSIYIATYIFNYDDVTKNIINALIKKAKDGIEIKILLDSMGSLALYFLQYRLKGLRDAGVQVEFFMPIFQMPLRNYINLRNHRKILIFDNKEVLSGGINLSEEYLGAEVDKTKWEDILFLIKGSSVEQFFEVFASDWFYATNKNLTFKKDSISNDGDIYMQVVPSGPDMPKDILYETLLSAIYTAKKRIWIVTPYFIPNENISQALIIAKHRGVDVKLITPKETNHIIANLARSSFIQEFEDAGIEVAFYNGAMLHAKAILFDDTGVMLGSVNLDNRSLFLNYEIVTFVYSSKVMQDVEIWIEKLISNCTYDHNNISAPRRIVENFLRVIAPQL